MSDRHRVRVTLADCNGSGSARCQHPDCGLAEKHPTVEDAQRAADAHEQARRGER